MAELKLTKLKVITLVVNQIQLVTILLNVMEL